jgi:hypothetical protein
VTWQRIANELRRADAYWQIDEAHRADLHAEPALSMSGYRAEEIVAQARELLVADPLASPVKRDCALIVTKAPHTGSDHTLGAIVARCLGFGLTIERIVRLTPDDADRVVNAIYPDVALNFFQLPTGNSLWSRIDRIFDRDGYVAIFGEPYRRAAVVTGRQACLDNQLTQTELMSIWQTGREPLTRTAAVAGYGRSAAEILFDLQNNATYEWYRGPFPIGIHKIDQNLMAFSLRHERLYNGRPVIVLNGHFTLLSQQFRGSGNSGSSVIEVGLDEHPTIKDIRDLLIGRASQPKMCLPGSIRRDAYDGFFYTDAPDRPVVPWANVVHASDGYLAGAVETAAVLSPTGADAMIRRLSDLGYSPAEIDTLIVRDPVVAAGGEEQRLTRRTALLPRDECMTEICRWFPPLGAGPAPPTSAYMMSTLFGTSCTDQAAIQLNRAHPEPGGRCPPPQTVRACVDLPDDLLREGDQVIASGGLGLMVPMAGNGGRFGGYDVPEGEGKRLKPLRQVFSVNERSVSAMDVRTAHVRFLEQYSWTPIPMLISCSHLTEPRIQDWLARNREVSAELVRVPEMYRIRLDHWDVNAGVAQVSGIDNILRDPDGMPLIKPSGNLGLLVSAAQSGVLRRWRRHGVRVVVAANADDVAFRVDRRIVGLFAASPDLDAVVLTIPFATDGILATPAEWRGGLLRERPVNDAWSAYVEEHAQPPTVSHNEHFSTNQIYFRVESLCRLLDPPTTAGMDAIRCRLPVYHEVKQVRIGDRQVAALHAYQGYPDLLRLLSTVTALSMTPRPRPGQPRGYAPLKSPSDVAMAQSVLDDIQAFGDELVHSNTQSRLEGACG